VRTTSKKHPNRRNLLISRRVLIGLDQMQLARAANGVRASNGKRTCLTQPEISHIENGTRIPTYEAAERIASVLNSNPVELFPDLYNTEESVPSGVEVRL
jgi:transcriptional regulator with XRE-family HTH domain